MEAAARATARARSPEELDRLLGEDSFDGEVSKAALSAVTLLGTRLGSDAERLRRLSAGPDG